MTITKVIYTLIGRLPHIYAVVDCARSAEVLPWLRKAGVQYECLFQGDKASSLAEEAPYLVDLGDDARATANLVTIGHDNNAVVYLQTQKSFEQVRRHVRRLLVVEDHDGEHLYFRFYDPRVARIFLPSCDEEQLSWMYGDIVNSWLICGQQPGELHELTMIAGEGSTPEVSTIAVVA